MRYLLIIGLALSCALRTAAADNLFRRGVAHASTQMTAYPASKAIDGEQSRASRWISMPHSRPPHVLEVELPFYASLDSIVIYTGIPAQEKRPAENGQSAGFWNMKNFVLQYWDDANWTDIPGTMTTENRLDRVSFCFPAQITSFRWRIHSTDGESIRILEFEGWGRENAAMGRPVTADRTEQLSAKAPRINATVAPRVTGRTMQYVGYNQGYYIPGSNASGWMEYAGVNSVRLWASLDSYVPRPWVDNGDGIEDLAGFEKRKAALRRDPVKSGMIRWDSINRVCSSVEWSTNSMELDYALGELRRLGVEVILQMGTKFPDRSWSGKWVAWQRYYALAYHCAQKGWVGMFAMLNEPNHRHAGPVPLDVWIEMSRVVSDAVHCAVEDVNARYDRQIAARFVGPVTAGTNTDWWARIAASEGIDYRGENTGRDQIDIFSTHSYNVPALGYANKVQGIDALLRENHPQHRTKPVVFTEIGRWMNAYLIDKEETMDSPSLFTEWAGIYANVMRGGGYGMWAFKFANTASSTYPRGIKSGHHHTWKGARYAEDAYQNLALGKTVTASASDEGFAAASVTDGNKGDLSAWRCSAPGGKWIEIELGAPTLLGGMAFYTGSEGGEFTAPDRMRTFTLEAWNGAKWEKVSQEKESRYAQVFLTFDPAIEASRLRLSTQDNTAAIVREVKLFGPGTLSAAPESWDVSGLHRTAEVVRLFAKGFKNSRPLLECSMDVEDPDVDVCASVDSLAGNMYVWLVQRDARDMPLSLDLGKLGLKEGSKAVKETVGPALYGEATPLTLGRGGVLDLTLGGQSVSLLTIPLSQRKPSTVKADRTAAVRGGKFAATAQGGKEIAVQLDSRTGEDNYAGYIHFTLDKKAVGQANRIMLRLSAVCPNGGKPMRMHVYATGESGWTEKSLTWNNAPALGDETNGARVTGVGQTAFVAGQITATGEKAAHWLDVTDLVKRHAADGVTFIVARELREPGDDYDKGRTALIFPRTSPDAPVIEIW